MSVAASILPSVDGTATSDLEQLRLRMLAMQDGPMQASLPVHPELSGLVRLQTGCSYGVDELSLALTLLAGPSRAGEWCAVVGITDFGAEAAAERGVNLARTVLVPDPGEQWHDVLGALVDVVPVVLLRPATRVSESLAARVGARLRKRGSVLLVQGGPAPWPRCQARFHVDDRRWSGLDEGAGRLGSREAVVRVDRPSAPPRRREVRLVG